MTVSEQAGKVATSAIETFRAQPGMLLITLLNLAFLVFVYFIGTLVLRAYDEQQRQIHERYQQALKVVDRCIEVALGELDDRPAREPPPDGGEGRR